MLANSENKQDLIKHLHGTMLMAMYSAKQIGVEDPDLINIIGFSAFLHDIGKCTVYFQNITLNKEDAKKYYPTMGDGSYPRHNEISWLYAIQYGKPCFKNIGAQAIYWHHGTFLKPSEILGDRTTKTIINDLDGFQNREYEIVFDEINNLLKSFNFPFDISKYLGSEKDTGSKSISSLFEDDSVEDVSNQQRMVIRSCVIFADHLVSQLTVDELDDLINNVEKYYPKNKDLQYGDFICPQNYNSARFDIQKNILKDCDRTTIIKAPAGFGKSLIGLMWGAKQSGQIYWVCPRNSVAQGVFDNLVREIEEFNLNVSIELFLTSERKDVRNGSNIPEGQCDIVITNIDNLLSPLVDQKSNKRIFDITTRNVVLDEYHEFINDEALFGAFIVYMKARNLIAKNCKTLLLSATPSVYNQFWDGNEEKTKILPNNDEHYPAQHKELYSIKIDNKFVNNPTDGSLTMYCSIRNVQNNFGNGYSHIIHSNYSDKDEEHNLEEIVKLFSKNGSKNAKVISAPILQSALDISFTGLYKTIESPESDIQTIGRINRWGEQQNKICDLNFLKLKSDKSENGSIKIRYDCGISKLWEQKLETIQVPVNLDSIYKIYNEFNKRNNNEIIKFIKEKLKTAIKKLQSFYPRQYISNKNADNKLIASKTLRNSNGGYFIVVKYRGSTNWCPYVFNIQKRELDELKQSNRSKIESSTIKTVISNLEIIGFDYKELKKKFFRKKKKKIPTIEEFEYFARCAESPLPIFNNWEYDNTLGLIKEK